MQMCHSVGCKLLSDNMESLGKSFLKTSKVESGLLVLVLRFCKCSNLPSAFAHT